MTVHTTFLSTEEIIDNIHTAETYSKTLKSLVNIVSFERFIDAPPFGGAELFLKLWDKTLL